MSFAEMLVTVRKVSWIVLPRKVRALMASTSDFAKVMLRTTPFGDVVAPVFKMYVS